ncbi:MAG: hypothetical protein COA36_02905 [Desulfotalea sp.]|nr:MAG: hypothetical protein COA36_02905 [Desulfotalea sp.]
MNTLTIQGQISPQYIPEQRHHQRFHIDHLLAVTKWGTGKIVEINHRGLSFGCLYPHTFQEQLDMDILDARGAHVRGLQVEKIWENKDGAHGTTNTFELIVGVSFVNPNYRQILAINDLLADTEGANLKYSHRL